MPYLYLFLRSVETAFGLLGMLISLSVFRKNIKLRLVLFAAAILVSCGVLTLVLMFVNKSVVEQIWLPLLFVVMLSGLMYVTADKWQVFLFNFFTNLSMYMLVSYVATLLSLLVSDQPMNYYYLLFRAILFTGVIYLEYRFVRKPFRRMINFVRNEWNIAIWIAGMFFIMHVLLSGYPFLRFHRSDYKHLLSIVTFVLMASVYYCLYMMLQDVITRHEKEQADAVLRLKLGALEQQIEMQKQSSENIRRTSHDLRHNCMVAIGQINSGDYAGAVDYLKQFTHLIDNYAMKSYCLNSSVNCILSALAQRAERAGISVDIKAKVPKQLLSIDEVELASLFANAFENAIDGCISVEEGSPFIHIYADYSDKMVLLSVKNSCGKVEFADDLPISTKSGGGTGTKSITYIAEKYHGMADFELSDHIFIMHAYLLDK